MTPAPDDREPVTARAILIGAALCVFLGVAAPYSTHLLRGSYMDLDYSTPAAVFLLFVLVALVNPVARVLTGRRFLSAAEIAVIYAMLMVGCALTTIGMASELIPTLAAARYYAHANPSWVARVLPYIKPWLIPGSFASDRLFTGLRPGESIPWSAWVVPLSVWAILLGAFYLFSICAMAIFRRPWMDRERLAYPLAQLPLDITRPAPGNRPLLRDAIMWFGFATAFAIASIRGVHHYFPTFPDFPDVLLDVLMFRQTLPFIIRISLPMIGFFFLANPEAVFTLWVFNRIDWAVQGWMNVSGIQFHGDLGPYSSAQALFGYLALGAFLGLAATTIHRSWPHLKAVARTALGATRPDDADEPLSYRAAFWGAVIGLAIMAAWLYMAGLPLYLTPLFLLGVIVILVAMTRIVIESGTAEAVPPTVPAGFTQAASGSSALGLHGLAAVSLTYIWAGDLRTLVMTSAAHGYRLGDVIKNRRALTAGMFVSVLVTGTAAVATTLYLGYTLGGVSLNAWFFRQGPLLPYNWISVRVASPAAPSASGWAFAVGGAVIAWLFAAMRARYVWWPLHPVGFAIAPTWLIDEIWASAVIAWLIRVMIVRYGGLRAYQRARPYFLGLILGQFTANGLWLVLDAVSGARGNQVFWI